MFIRFPCRFFEIRQPFACLLDPELHTPEQVYSRSFTLFSVICAMGCAVSVRPRDRILYPALLSMAENSMKWAIASAVKCLAVIQSIIIMQYWAPLCPRQSDDPSWLRFGHVSCFHSTASSLTGRKLTLVYTGDPVGQGARHQQQCYDQGACRYAVP